MNGSSAVPRASALCATVSGEPWHWEFDQTKAQAALALQNLQDTERERLRPPEGAA